LWAFVNDGPVKLSIEDGQELNWAKCEPTEEGYHAEFETFSREGCRIYSERTINGRDCDGAVSHRINCVAFAHELMAREDPAGTGEVDTEERLIRYPNWRRVSSRVYDEYAQAAGY
jgi:hypothetical protein